MVMKADYQGYVHGVGACRVTVTHLGVCITESVGINAFAVKKLRLGFGRRQHVA